MYTEEEEYEEYKSWREDIEFMDRTSIYLNVQNKNKVLYANIGLLL